MNEVILNESQQKAVDIIKHKIKNFEGGYLTVSGGAGMGKTFCVKYAVEDIIDNSDFIAITPSHKACGVLTNSIGRQSVTLASALGIKLNETNGKFRPDPMAEKSIKDKRYILIDEVSMVSEELLNEIENEAEDNALIIMMGDSRQLPPVGAKPGEISPAFSRYDTIHLTEIMRQKEGSTMIPFLCNITDSIDDLKEFSMDKIESDDVKFSLTKDDFIKSFVKDSRLNPQGTRAMTYNNEKSANPLGVKLLNEAIVMKLHGGFDFKKDFQVMAYGGFYHKPKERNPSISPFKLINSVDYTIIKVGQKRNSTRDVRAYIKDPRDGRKGVKITPITIEVQKVTLSSNIEDYVFECELPTFSDKGVGKLQEIVGLAFHAEEYSFGYKLLELFPYVLPGYACSSHKSQGSTYENAYVAYENIITQKNVAYKDRLKSLYVSASRASNKIVIL